MSLGDSESKINIPKWLDVSPLRFNIKNAHESVEILREPTEFYQLLITETGCAKERISWSSLYFGHGLLEKELILKLSQRLKNDSNITFQGIFDYCRGLRGGLSSSTLGMFLPVLSQYPNRAKVYLFRSPFFRGFKNYIPQRWNEIFSVHHMKLYVFDSTVILSGANLSDSYFTNRQDRYIVIRNAPEFANFCCDIIKTLGSLSFTINPDGSLKPTDPKLIDPKDSYSLQNVGHSHIKALLDRYAQKNMPTVNASNDTVIFPFLQSAPLGIRDEECVIESMLKSLKSNEMLYLSTSYFNLTKRYQTAILNDCKSEAVKMYISSPRSNGFSGASGFSRFVPHGYIYFARRFNEQIVKTKQENRIQLYEYERHGWTFHSKGVWLCPRNAPDSSPYLSFLGSTNFSFRSVNRDQESQFVLYTSNPALRRRLKVEVDDLNRWCIRVDRAAFARPDHAIARWVPLASKIARYFF